MTTKNACKNNACKNIVVQLTSPGRGAIASVRVEGFGCVETTDCFFCSRNGKTLAETPVDRSLVGHFHAPTSPSAEEVVARRCVEPSGVSPNSSYAVEIHCHGGTASVLRIVEAFRQAGHETVPWNEWTDLGTQSSTCAEAYRDLAHASTELTASLLLDQYHGALDRELREIDQTGDPAEKKRRLDVLLRRATWGIHLTRPWQVVLAGSPNVGKSSLMNRLLGYDRAIIDTTPGTTRDLLRTQTVFGGWPVELIDTAGLRESNHPIERIGVERALAQLQSADLVLLLLDATRPPTDEELFYIGSIREPKKDCFASLLPVRTKSDLAKNRDTWGSFAETAVAREAIDTSAKSGEGIDHLISAIESKLFPSPLPEPGTPIPWTDRQIAELRRMEQALSSCY